MKRLFERLSRISLYRQIPEDEVVSMQQFVLFRIFSYAGILVCLGVFFKMVLTIKNVGLTPSFILILASVMLINFFSVNKVKNLRRSYIIMLISAFLLLHLLSYSCGGIRTGGTLYFSTIILYAFMLLGRKGGLWFSAATIINVIYLFVISKYTNWTSFSLFKENIELINEDFLINAILTTFLIASQGNYLQSRKNVVIERLEKSKKLLEKNYILVEEKNNLLNDYANSLEKKNAELEKFASIASHDLKAPLRAIGNLTGIIEDEAGHLFDEEVNNNFSTIKNRVERMELLLNALLEYSKVERSKENFQFVNIFNLLNTILPRYANNISIKIDFDKNLPKVVAAPKKLQIVFENLIENAIRFNDKEAINIKITSEETDDYWLFSVKDNGPGIEKRYHEKVFIIFQTLNRRDDVESIGVGLSIAKKIVEDFGGRIWVESEINNGADFRFTLNKHTIKRKLALPLISKTIKPQVSEKEKFYSNVF